MFLVIYMLVMMAVAMWACAAIEDLQRKHKEHIYRWHRLLKKNPDILAAWDDNEAPK